MVRRRSLALVTLSSSLPSTTIGANWGSSFTKDILTSLHQALLSLTVFCVEYYLYAYLCKYSKLFSLTNKHWTKADTTSNSPLNKRTNTRKRKRARCFTWYNPHWNQMSKPTQEKKFSTSWTNVFQKTVLFTRSSTDTRLNSPITTCQTRNPSSRHITKQSSPIARQHQPQIT